MKYKIPCYRILVATIVVGLASVSGLNAQTREWAKYHLDFTFESDVVAETTVITTSDSADPHMSRYLYYDGTNERLVYRFTHWNSAAFDVTVANVSGSDQLAISMDGATPTVTMDICGTALTFDEGEEELPSTRSQASAAFGNCPQGFQDSVTAFVNVALTHIPQLHSTAEFLRDLLFPTIAGVYNTGTEEATYDLVGQFDPNTTPPSVFDTPFGNHYYE